MELRQIEAFLVLAEELHFGRTAGRLRVSQALVSQTLRSLERRVGGLLFERTSRRVALTRLGEQLRDDLRVAYDQFDRAFEQARAATSGIDGELRVCVQSLAAAGHSFTRICTTFTELHPACRLLVSEGGVADGYDGLRTGVHDILATWLPHRHADVRVGPLLAREERVLAVQVGHPLAQRGWATSEDLGDHAVARGGAVHEPLVPRNTPSGRPVPWKYPVGSMPEAMLLIARGVIVHPTVASADQFYRHPDVILVPLHGLPALESALIWPTGRETAAVTAFVRAAREVLGDMFEDATPSAS
ncbi:LysR family transcriptional regulator [Pseudonocardia kunmingensis]|uniref:DNA-binding transcriptional LysR family regulator n=1 Tax=Pseudonocardia kunmingensis TaxID=630975 RepID=A0A543DQ95_9PSEU|nr:LysR family transcriptional regulator [Pseudonocardia kunmingensis]TQM11483.1 DNA-binding transcriptional LysR family regulator [Pseudonocardia kunmingensis]